LCFKLQVHEGTGTGNQLCPPLAFPLLLATRCFISFSAVMVKLSLWLGDIGLLHHLKFFAGIKDVITVPFIKNESSIILLHELHIICTFFEAFLKAELTCFKLRFNCIPYDILHYTATLQFTFRSCYFYTFHILYKKHLTDMFMSLYSI
jgi:hypothetical protein